MFHSGFVPQMPKKGNPHTLGPHDLHYKTTFSSHSLFCCCAMFHCILVPHVEVNKFISLLMLDLASKIYSLGIDDNAIGDDEG